MKIPAVPSWWSDKWHDLPLVGGSSEVPEHDGDTSLLTELRDRIELAATTLPIPDLFEAVHYIDICSGSIEQVLAMEYTELLAPWTDPAGDLLSAWKDARKKAA